MKKSLLIFLMILAGLNVFSQPPGTTSKKGIAPFNIQLADGKRYTSKELDKSKALLIVYFDPDCDHCHTFIKALQQQISSFENVQIVMVTYVPMSRLKTYIQTSGIGKFPQIRIGTEGNTFTVRYYYNVIQFPFLALHDRNGSLSATYESEVPSPKELSMMFNNMK